MLDRKILMAVIGKKKGSLGAKNPEMLSPDERECAVKEASGPEESPYWDKFVMLSEAMLSAIEEGDAEKLAKSLMLAGKTQKMLKMKEEVEEESY